MIKPRLRAAKWRQIYIDKGSAEAEEMGEFTFEHEYWGSLGTLLRQR